MKDEKISIYIQCSVDGTARAPDARKRAPTTENFILMDCIDI